MTCLNEDISVQTGRVSLLELGINIILPKEHYHIREFCEDVNKGIERVCKNFGINALLSKKKDILGWSGLINCNVLQNRKNKTVMIHYQIIKKGLNLLNYVSTIAHEDGHFLEDINAQNKIYYLLGVENLGYHNEEFAYLCELWALHKKGIDIKTISQYSYEGDILNNAEHIQSNMVSILEQFSH
jgi:hypothetical protein